MTDLYELPHVISERLPESQYTFWLCSCGTSFTEAENAALHLEDPTDSALRGLRD